MLGLVGLDLCVMFKEDSVFGLGQILLIFIGLFIYIVDFGFVVLVLLCFGLGYKYGIVLGNLVGLIDLDYQGELMVLCWNCGELLFIIVVGECIVQLVLVLVVQVYFELVEVFDESQCGVGGFGYFGSY